MENIKQAIEEIEEAMSDGNLGSDEGYSAVAALIALLQDHYPELRG